MIRTLYFHQLYEQARFRTGYSTIDQLQIVNQLQQEANKYNTPLRFAFVDYAKAFTRIEFEPHFEGLIYLGVEWGVLEHHAKPLYRGNISSATLQ